MTPPFGSLWGSVDQLGNFWGDGVGRHKKWEGMVMDDQKIEGDELFAFFGGCTILSHKI